MNTENRNYRTCTQSEGCIRIIIRCFSVSYNDTAFQSHLGNDLPIHRHKIRYYFLPKQVFLLKIPPPKILLIISILYIKQAIRKTQKGPRNDPNRPHRKNKTPGLCNHMTFRRISLPMPVCRSHILHHEKRPHPEAQPLLNN